MYLHGTPHVLVLPIVSITVVCRPGLTLYLQKKLSGTYDLTPTRVHIYSRVEHERTGHAMSFARARLRPCSRVTYDLCQNSDLRISSVSVNAVLNQSSELAPV
jgi:hypothetical protein